MLANSGRFAPLAREGWGDSIKDYSFSEGFRSKIANYELLKQKCFNFVKVCKATQEDLSRHDTPKLVSFSACLMSKRAWELFERSKVYRQTISVSCQMKTFWDRFMGVLCNFQIISAKEKHGLGNKTTGSGTLCENQFNTLFAGTLRFSPKNVNGDQAINLSLYIILPTALCQFRFRNFHLKVLRYSETNLNSSQHLHSSYSQEIPVFFFTDLMGYSLIQCKSLSRHIPVYMYLNLAHLLGVIPKHCSLFCLLLLLCFFFPWPPFVPVSLRRLPCDN